MRDFFSKFFRNKFNIALLIVQCIALAFFLLGNFWGVAFIFAVLSESVFFILLGIRLFKQNKEILSNQDIMLGLPIAKSEMESLEKSNKKNIRANKLQAILCIFMGIVLFFIVIF